MKQILIIFAVCLFTIGASQLFLNKNNPREQEKSLYETVLERKSIRCGYALLEPSLVVNPNTKELSGIAYDLMNKIGENLGLKIEWTHELGMGELVTAIETKQVDMICSTIWLTSMRAKVIDNTNPIFFFPSTIWVSNSNKTFSKKAEDYNSSDITFVALEGSSSMNQVKRFFPNAKILALPEMSNVAENLLTLAANKADATILPRYLGQKFLANNSNAIKEVLEKPFKNDPVVMLMPKGEEEFKSMINAALDELHYSGYLDNLIDKYTKDYPNGVYKKAVAYRE